MHQRLIAAAEKARVKKHTLALMAIEAAVEAIEDSGKLVIPLQFDVTHVAVEKSEARAAKKTRSTYPQHRPQGNPLNEDPPKKK